MRRWRMVIDLKRCVGCNSCTLACKIQNGTPPGIFFRRVLETISGKYPAVRRTYLPTQCMHCEEPACEAACIVGALRKTPEGPVVYDDYKCIGCRYCTLACPFGVPTFDWDKPVPYIRKCTMCEDRLAEDIEPACSKACPTQALLSGEREALVQEARSRIQAHPDKYVDHIYGENEVGGTSKLYLSSVSYDKLGFPTLESEPIPRYSDVAMAAVPPTIVVVSAAMAGVYWIVRRREKMMSQAVPRQTQDAEEFTEGKED